MAKIPGAMEQADVDFGVWRRWIASIAWRYFCTFTFHNPVERKVITYADRIVRWGASASDDRCLLILCGERGGRTGRFHMHGLLDTSHAGLRAIDDEWRRRYGHTTIRRFQQGRGACDYVTKYTVKDAAGIGSIELSGAGGNIGRWQKWCSGDYEEEETFGWTKTFAQKTPEEERVESGSFTEKAWNPTRRMTGYDRYLRDVCGLEFPKRVIKGKLKA